MLPGENKLHRRSGRWKAGVLGLLGMISLRGVARSKELRDLIVDTASGVKGVVDCKAEMRLLPSRLR